MKVGVLNSLARSTGDYLTSRNSDIDGYWSIGVLCAIAVGNGKPEFGFKIYPGRPIIILGREISGSKAATDKLVRLKLDAVEGWFIFVEVGRYPNGATKYQCTLTLSLRKSGRAGKGSCRVECWPHDPTREHRSTRADERADPSSKQIAAPVDGTDAGEILSTRAPILPYANATRLVSLPTPRSLKVFAGLIGLFILGMHMLGLAPLAGAVDYTRDIPMSEIWTYSWSTYSRGLPTSASASRAASFVPVALLGLAFFLTVRRGILRNIVIILNIAMPLGWAAHLLPIVMIVGPAVLAIAAAGYCDGETWSEGFVCLSAYGSWSTLWLAVGFVLFIRRLRQRRHARTD